MIHFIVWCLAFYGLYIIIFKLGEWAVLGALVTGILSVDLFKWIAHAIIGTPEENSK